MSRDYKASPRKNSHSGGGSTLTGILIGLVLGVAIAIGVTFYLNKVPARFDSKVNPPAALPAQTASDKPEVLAPGVIGGGSNQPATPAIPSNPTSAESKPAQAGERFDFYTMLPELGNEAKSAPAAKPAEPTAPATVTPPKGIYVQVGAFQNETDADNLKAKLAIMGVEANISSSEVAGHGLMHRVRVGPLAQAADLERVRKQLQASGVESTIVKQ